MNNMNSDSTKSAVVTDDKNVKTVAVTYSNFDGKIGASAKEIVHHYLHIKNTLANDNGNEAANGVKAMEVVIKNLGKSILTAGGGRALYHDHCPMYNDNKGAMWLNEMREVKNTYYGSQMLSCGKTIETIKQ